MQAKTQNTRYVSGSITGITRNQEDYTKFFLVVPGHQDYAHALKGEGGNAVIRNALPKEAQKEMKHKMREFAKTTPPDQRLGVACAVPFVHPYTLVSNGDPITVDGLIYVTSPDLRRTNYYSRDHKPGIDKGAPHQPDKKLRRFHRDSLIAGTGASEKYFQRVAIQLGQHAARQQGTLRDSNTTESQALLDSIEKSAPRNGEILAVLTATYTNLRTTAASLNVPVTLGSMALSAGTFNGDKRGQTLVLSRELMALFTGFAMQHAESVAAGPKLLLVEYDNSKAHTLLSGGKIMGTTSQEHCINAKTGKEDPQLTQDALAAQAAAERSASPRGNGLTRMSRAPKPSDGPTDTLASRRGTQGMPPLRPTSPSPMLAPTPDTLASPRGARATVPVLPLAGLSGHTTQQATASLSPRPLPNIPIPGASGNVSPPQDVPSSPRTEQTNPLVRTVRSPALGDGNRTDTAPGNTLHNPQDRGI
jgi:hypothetical protein